MAAIKVRAGSGDAPPHLLEAIDIGLEDLSLASPVKGETSVEVDLELQDFWLVYIRLGDVETGFGVDVSKRPAELLECVVDGLQEAFIEFRQGAIPRCPFHEHPLRVAAEGEVAWWYCPGPSDWRRRVGSLAADEAYQAAIQTGPR